MRVTLLKTLVGLSCFLVLRPLWIGLGDLPGLEASAWLLFGVGLSPLLFAVVFLVFFRRWYVTPQTLESFRQLVPPPDQE